MTIGKAINSLISNLTPRQKEVISGRFGLGRDREIKTLAAIGDKMGLTRERVRQIEESGLEAVKNALENHKKEVERFIGTIQKEIEKSGGVLKEKGLFRSLSRGTDNLGLERNRLLFLGEISGAFRFYPEDNDFEAFYYSGKPALEKLRGFISGLAGHLEKNKEKVLVGQFEESLAEWTRISGAGKRLAAVFLELSKVIQANRYGDRGLASWPEVAPTTARDRAHLVLCKKGQPMHFAKIAKDINDMCLGIKATLAATVHNELIKDPRFVLVGRGIYALRAQGYEAGTAREVIERVLQKRGPLRPEEIVGYVNKERVLKPNTIQVNLQNKGYFEHLADGRYRVRLD